MYQALYRKWRSKTFDEVLGQEHITSVIKNQCRTGKTSHAYLFCGSRGTGKTSTAKILAKAVNCLSPTDGNPCGKCENCIAVESGSATDISEIDAASNNGVDNIRDLRDEVVYAPAMLKYRVYIIDEVHMLSTGAFNALLKTLEEPPENVIFILATTELNKIPPTILSRCQRFEFRRIDSKIITERLLDVAKAEKINLSSDAATLIARLADGGMRDALSMLDSCLGGNDDNAIDLSVVQKQLGVSSSGNSVSMLEYIVTGDVSSCLVLLKTIHYSARDLTAFLTDLIKLIRDALIYSKTKKTDNINIFFDKAEKDRFIALADKIPTEQLLCYADMLEDAYYRLSRYSQNKLFEFEMTIIKMCDLSLSDSTKAILARLSRIEKQVENGNYIKKDADIINKTAEKAIIKPEEKIIDSSIIEKPVIKPKKDINIPKKDETSDIEEDFEEISDYLDEMKGEPQLYSLLEVSKLKLCGNELRIYCDPFAAMILKQKSTEQKLQESIDRVFGSKYTIKIEETKNTEDKKSGIDDITIFD